MVNFTNTFASQPLIFAQKFEKMYLKLIRHKSPAGQLRRGTLYRVHFQPNEKGGFNEHLTSISDVYEISTRIQSPISNYQSPMEVLPPLIYPVGVTQVDGRWRLVFGVPFRRSLLHLIDRNARDAFFIELRSALRQGTDVRIEVCNL